MEAGLIFIGALAGFPMGFAFGVIFTIIAIDRDRQQGESS